MALMKNTKILIDSKYIACFTILHKTCNIKKITQNKLIYTNANNCE